MDLTTLTSVAATTLVKLLAKDGWEQVKAAVVGLWRRAHPDRVAIVEAELTETRDEMVAAQQAGDEQTERDLVSEWQGRLRRLVSARPELAEDLELLVDELRATMPEHHVARQRIQGDASGHGRVYQAGRDLHITDR